VLRESRKRFPCANSFHVGATDLGPENLAIWITTETDAQRDALLGDALYQRQFRQILAEVGYPAEAISQVGLAIESQETVDRDYEGSWFYATR